MPNYCDNRIGFICDEANTKDLKQLYDILYTIFNTSYHCKNGFGESWLGRVALEHGLNVNEIPCKGEILDVGDLDEDEIHFKIFIESHWRVNVELWDAVVKQYTGIRYVYISDEPSGGIYINTDIEGVCFPEKYIIFANMSDSSYDELPSEYFTDKIAQHEIFDETYRFNSFKELQDFMSEITGKTFTTVKRMNSYFHDAMAEYDETNGSLDDSIIEIHEYSSSYKED